MKNYSHTLKRFLKKSVLPMMFGTMLVAGLNSCDNEEWNDLDSYFYDSRLKGYWQLVEVNGEAVDGYSVDFMSFNGGGQGELYYYVNTDEELENLQYTCQESVNDVSEYQINIMYDNSSTPKTMNYTFDNDNQTLHLLWIDNGVPMDYTYTAYPYEPW